MNRHGRDARFLKEAIVRLKTPSLGLPWAQKHQPKFFTCSSALAYPRAGAEAISSDQAGAIACRGFSPAPTCQGEVVGGVSKVAASEGSGGRNWAGSYILNL